MKHRWLIPLVILALTHTAWSQTRSWAHYQVEGESTETFSVTVTIGSLNFTIENIPAGSTATQVARDVADEINSARHGHLYYAATNGVDNSIVSIIADGSPTTSTTPWMGRLMPIPQFSLAPGNPGIRIRSTNINDTLLAVAVEGDRAEVDEGEISVKLNGETFTVEFGREAGGAVGRSAAELVSQLSVLIDEDAGFRSSVLRNDTGQLMLFISSENMGGGVNLQNGPTNVEGVRFSNARQPFARDVLYLNTTQSR